MTAIEDARAARVRETAWRRAIADQVRRNCTPSMEAYAKGGDALIYAVADWIEKPPAWSQFDAPQEPTTDDEREALAVVESALAFWNNGRGHNDSAWVSRMAHNMAEALQRAAATFRRQGPITDDPNRVELFNVDGTPRSNDEIREEAARKRAALEAAERAR